MTNALDRYRRAPRPGPMLAAPTPAPGPESRGVSGEELWWPPGGSAGVVVTEQTALQLAALLATVNTIATDTAVLPLCVHQVMPDGSSREAKEHGNYELLARSPDGLATPIRWRQAWMGHALVYGNGFAEIQRGGNGRPYALHLLDPATTRPKREPGGGPLAYQIGNGRTIAAADVLHIAGLGFDGVSGYNMVRLLRQAIGLGIAEETFASDYFSNGSEPGGTIEVPGRLKDEDAVTRLRNRWNNRHQGAGKRHGVAILEEGAKYSPTSTEPEKSQLLESRKFQVIDTIRPWRLPPHKAGDFSQSHLANIEASNLDYLMSALMGWLVTIEQESDLKLFTRKEWLAGYRVKHDVNALLRGDLKSRFDSYSQAIRDGWMSRNEVRRKENMDPIPSGRGGDLYTTQMQNVPLGAPPEKPAGPAPGVGTRSEEERFNPHHGKDGKFGSGNGGGGTVHAAGREHPASELQDTVAAAAAEHGRDMSLVIRPPATDAGRRTSAEAEAEGKYLIQAKVTPRYTTDSTGPYLMHKVGGKVDAVTFPASRTPRQPPNPADKDWISRTFEFDISNPKDDYRSSVDTRFRTERLALKHSRKTALDKVREGTGTTTVKSPDFGRSVNAAARAAPPASEGKVTLHLVVPGKEKETP